MRVGIHQALLRGAKYLGANQLDNGGFISQSVSYHSDIVLTYHTTFIPSQILSCIADVDIAELAIVKQKLSEFILAQKSAHWSYNYWARTSHEFLAMPYPDDLDDTFCALSALLKNNHSILDGKALGDITQLLVATEADEGGPYRTWLVDAQADKAWCDIDIAVNANVGYFLSLNDVALPNIESLIETAIQQKHVSSPYYPNAFPVAYFISRWYRGKSLRKMVGSVYRRKHDTPLKAALKLSALIHSGNRSLDPKPLVDYLLNTQAVDGSWPADDFCIDPTIDGKAYYARSSSLTTAFCIEALCMYSRSVQEQTTAAPGRTHDRVYSRVVRGVEQDVRRLKSPELRAQTTSMLRAILARDNDHQIILLPYITSEALGLSVDPNVLIKLATASLWGWIAYTIYDDFLDNEGRPDMLPTANVALRSVVSILTDTIPESPLFQSEVCEILNKLDGANAWEVSHCRGTIKQNRLYINELPDYGNYWQLAERSLGHTISGLGVLYATNAPAEMVRALRRFYYHYLIARQLNDDAHDWQADLGRTHINAAGVRVLRKWQTGGRSLQQGVDLQSEAETLNLIMWEHVIQDVVDDIDVHIKKARKALAKFPAGSKTELFDNLLIPLERAAHRALDERNNAIKFIHTLDTN